MVQSFQGQSINGSFRFQNLLVRSRSPQIFGFKREVSRGFDAISQNVFSVKKHKQTNKQKTIV